jgi:hypothetical protein
VGRARKIIDRVPVNVWIAESMIADLDAYAAELQRATTGASAGATRCA